MLRDFPLPATVPVPAPTSAASAGTAAPDAAPGAVPVRAAATVMLVRPGASGVEVFTFRRIRRLAFAAGMLVFPGGAVDPRDADPAVPWAGPPPSEFAAALSADEGLARAVVTAAVRETFEECGVLLAGPAGGDPLARTLVGQDDWDSHRSDLIEGSVGLSAVLRRHHLVLRADLLRPWAHWITPVGEPRRFDTRFFVAALPPGQQAHDLGGEGERAAWLPPAEALARHAAGDLPMLPPTVVALEELAAATSVAQLLATRRVPRPVSPWVARAGTAEDGSERYVLRIDLDGLGGGESGPGPSAAPAPDPSVQDVAGRDGVVG